MTVTARNAWDVQDVRGHLWLWDNQYRPCVLNMLQLMNDVRDLADILKLKLVDFFLKGKGTANKVLTVKGWWTVQEGRVVGYSVLRKYRPGPRVSGPHHMGPVGLWPGARAVMGLC